MVTAVYRLVTAKFRGCIVCNRSYILFTMLPWPRDSKGTFRSSTQAAHLSTTHGGGFTLSRYGLLIAERQSGKP